MKKFVITLAIVALVGSVYSTGQGFSACKEPRGQCRSRRRAMMECIPRKCLQGMAQCMHQLEGQCMANMQQCTQGLDLKKCHDQRGQCEMNKGANSDPCGAAMQQCEKKLNMDQCHNDFNTCMQNAPQQHPDPCQTAMDGCTGQIAGYKACHDAMTTCNNAQATATPPNWEKCSADYQTCYNGLDQNAIMQCSNSFNECYQNGPMGQCNKAQEKCMKAKGRGVCQHHYDECRRKNPDQCEGAWQECFMQAGGARCQDEGQACRAGLDHSTCMTNAKNCAKDHAGADLCLDSMLMMKSMEHQPPQFIRECAKAAGVPEGGNPERSGDACKLAECAVPQFPAPQAQCWLNCHFGQNCGCTNLVDPTSGCAKLNKPGRGRGRRGGNHHLEMLEIEGEEEFLNIFN